MKKTNKTKDGDTCPKCLGSGDLPGKRGNHPSFSETKKCWTCNGTGNLKNNR